MFVDCDSIFKTEWFEIPDTWQDVQLAESFDYTSVIKKALNAHISPEDPNEFDIAISTQPHLFQKLKVRSNKKFCLILFCVDIQYTRLRKFLPGDFKMVALVIFQ